MSHHILDLISVFKKILVGIDTFIEAQHAFDDALSIAKATGASLSLRHIFSWDDAMLYSEFKEIENNEELIEGDRLLAFILSRYRGHDELEILRLCAATVQNAGVQVEVELVRFGKPGRNLCDAARIEKADLIAVGHRDKDWGKTPGLGEFRLGSVSHEVIHRAHCSVLIAHRSDVSVGALTDMRRILTTLDDSVMSEVVFQESLDLAKATGANLTLLHVLSPSKRNRPLEKLQLLKDRANAEGVSVNIEQLISENHSIGQVICEFADEKKIDLIIVGRRRLLEGQEQILGSVSHYIAYQAPCAVLIVKHLGQEYGGQDTVSKQDPEPNPFAKVIKISGQAGLVILIIVLIFIALTLLSPVTK